MITLAITHFDRPNHLKRCLDSIRRFYPDIPIMVGDNSVKERPTVPDDVTLIHAEPDAGLSATRNLLVQNCKTKYILIMEEDFIFTEETRIEKFQDVLNEGVDLVAGCLEEISGVRFGSFHFVKRQDGKLQTVSKHGPYSYTAKGTLWQRCDFTWNFFLTTTELLKKYPWPDHMKVGDEHITWFTSLGPEVKIAHTPQVIVVHDRGGRDEHYLQYRQRTEWRKRDEPLHLDTVKKQNVIVFGVGHSGTTVLSKMLNTLGFKVNNNDEEYYEDADARFLNLRILKNKPADIKTYLKGLQGGWLIKDPRMVVTLPHWIDGIAASGVVPPVLIYIKKQYDSVLKSYQRRGYDGNFTSHGGYTVHELFHMADRQYERWPWQKITVDFEDLGKAASFFDQGKLIQSSEPIAPFVNETNVCSHRGKKIGSYGTKYLKENIHACVLHDVCMAKFLKPDVKFLGDTVKVCSMCPDNNSKDFVPEVIAEPEPEPEPIMHEIPCMHRKEIVDTVGCGCGSEKKVPIYICTELGFCIDHSINKHVVRESIKVQNCAFCGKYQQWMQSSQDSQEVQSGNQQGTYT